jgi:hypothetical protein
VLSADRPPVLPHSLGSDGYSPTDHARGQSGIEAISRRTLPGMGRGSSSVNTQADGRHCRCAREQGFGSLRSGRGRGIDCASLPVGSHGWPLVENPEEAEGRRSGARICRTS